MSKLILLVDDDVTVLAPLFMLLEQAGHRVILAAGGHEAAKALTKSRFDVIVTDIFMPGVDGLEVIRLARAADARVRIVAMSGYDRHSGFHTLAVATYLGANETLQKPIEPAQLLSAVAGLPSTLPDSYPMPGLSHEEELTNAAEI